MFAVLFAAVPGYGDSDNVSIGRITSKSPPTQVTSQGELRILTEYMVAAPRFGAEALVGDDVPFQ